MFNSFATTLALQNILIIEDDPLDHLSIRDYLGMEGESAYRIEVWTSNCDMIEVIRAHPPACLLLDSRLTHADPFQILKSLKKAGLLKTVAVVLMANEALTPAALQEIDVGVIDWLDTSGLTPAYVRYVVRSAIEKQVLLQERNGLLQELEIKSRQLENINTLVIEREQFFKHMADTAPSGWCVTNPQGEITFVNQVWQTMTGLGYSESMGATWLQLVLPDRQERISAQWRQAISAQKPFNLECPILFKGGEPHWCMIKAQPTYLYSGAYSGYNIFFMDIDHRVEIETELKASEIRWRTLANLMPAMVWISNVNGSVEFYNEQSYQYSGLKPESTLGFGWVQVIHPDDRERFNQTWQSAFQKQESYEIEIRYRRYDGEYRWFIARAVPKFSASGELEQYYGASIDVHDRHVAEEGLRQSERQLRRLIESNLIGIFTWRLDGQITDANDAFLEIVGATRTQLKAHALNWQSLTPPEWVDQDRVPLSQLLHTGICDPFEKQYLLADGALVDVLIKAAMLDESLDEGVAFVMDITERKRTERQLTIHARQQEAIAQLSQLGLVNVDLQTFIELTLKTLTQTLGHQFGQVFQLLPESMQFKLVASTGWPAGAEEAALFQNTSPSAMSYTLQYNQPIIFSSLSDPSRLVDIPLLREQGINCGVTMAIVVKGEPWGVISSYAKTEQEFTDSDLNFVHGMTNILSSVIERKEAFEALRRSESNLKRFIDANIIGIIHWDLNGDILGTNDAFLSLLGYTRAELEQGLLNWQELTPPECKNADEAALKAIQTTGIAHPYEKQFFHKDGRRIDVILGGYRFEGNETEGISYVLDISRQKQVERDLQASEARFRQVLESNMIGIVFSKSDGSISKVNDAFLQMVGYTQEDLREGRINWRTLTAPEYVDVDIQVTETLAVGKSSPLHEKQYIHKDGHRVDVIRGVGRLSESPAEFVAFVLDLSEKKQIERALVESEERFRSMADASPMMIMLCDKQQKLIYYNQAMTEFTGQLLCNSILKGWENLMEAEDIEMLYEMKRSAVEHRQVELREIRMKYHDGSLRWILMTCVARFSEHDYLGSMETLVDIHDRKVMEMELRRAKEQAEAANRKKSDFLAMMSHELRTPLNAIIGYSRMIENGMAGPIQEKQRQYLQNVGISGQHLLNLINDLLDVSKVEAGKMKITRQAVQLGPLIGDVKSMTTELAGRNHLSLNFELDPELDVINVDAGRFRQILLNLISNAIKFNKPGGSVWVRLSPSADGLNLVGEVEDTGIGLPEAKIPELFNKFYQVDNSSARQHEGTGLGLSLTKDLIELHGGEIVVKSTEGIGTTFRFQIPTQFTHH